MTPRNPPSADPHDFAPPLLRIEERPPPPLAGWMLRLLVGLVAGLILLAVFGRLDIVAVAEGKLVPSSYLQIVQPPEQGVVKEILVKEGQPVRSGEVLVRMDPVLGQADAKSLQTEYQTRRLALRRIDAQLEGKPLVREKGDPAEFFIPAEAQYRANLQAYENALAQEKSLLDKAKNDLAGARETKIKLEQVLPQSTCSRRCSGRFTTPDASADPSAACHALGSESPISALLHCAALRSRFLFLAMAR